MIKHSFVKMLGALFVGGALLNGTTNAQDCGCQPAMSMGSSCSSGCDMGSSMGCDMGCSSHRKSRCGDCFLFGDGEAIEVFGSIPCTNISAGGWTQIGYTTQGVNGVGTDLFNNYPNNVQLQQQWFWLEKSLDTSCGMDWGFRVDYLYGTDGPDTQSFGQDSGWDVGWTHGEYGHAIPQLYGEIGVGDLSVKIGHFYTIIGYEVVQAPDNFFYSHAYTQYLAEPFTHSGFLATWEMNDTITLHGGWTAGWDTGFRWDGPPGGDKGSNFLGGVSVKLFDDITATYAVTAGNFGNGANGSDSNGYSHSIVVDFTITDKLNYVFQSDYVDNDNFIGSTRNIYGFNNYLIYTMSDCFALGARAEYFNDPRMATTPTDTGEVVELTIGANYKPHANVVIRPEIRWNWFQDNMQTPVSGVTPAQDEAIFGIDTVITY